MNYESILIVGCGRLGTMLGESLAASGVRVYGTRRHSGNFPGLEKAGILPLLLDLESPGSFFSQLPKVDAVVISLTPVQPGKLVELVTYLEHLNVPVVVTSSTSVYPDKNHTVTEADAEAIKSPHSGLVMLEVENAFYSLKPVILRFGGLFGEEMPPGTFLMDRTNIPGGLNPVNMTHLEDARNAITFALSARFNDAVFNVVSPEHPSRQDFYHEAARKLGVEPPGFLATITPHKVVSSEAILNAGFTFTHKNPINAL